MNTDTDGGDFRGGGAAPGTPCSGAARVEGATMVSGDVWADDEPRYARERTRRAVGEPAVIAGEFRGALGQALRVGVVGRMRRLLSRERP